MSGDGKKSKSEKHAELTARIVAEETKNAANEADIAALQHAAEHSAHRTQTADGHADESRIRIVALEGRADQANHRADSAEVRADTDRDRLGALEEQVDVHTLLIAELQAEGLVSTKQAHNLEAALRTARTISTAMGILMAKHNLPDAEAFDMLRKASMDSNRKLRDVADEVRSSR
ncbi:MAG: ANTAR domain-containing protein [Candidatus Phosphoribacter sp.]